MSGKKAATVGILAVPVIAGIYLVQGKLVRDEFRRAFRKDPINDPPEEVEENIRLALYKLESEGAMWELRLMRLLARRYGYFRAKTPAAPSEEFLFIG
ncbi:MAG TPA: hypothetical protein VMA75_03585 [Candidatus Paceibacterota bacterium]|nr:hypothetical protein [Candidatus Paceibacterota bacterium]